MSEDPTTRWYRSVVWPNALIIFLAGPIMALLFYGLAWVLDRPHPLDVVFLLVRCVAVGFVVGTSASVCYLAYHGVKRLWRNRTRFGLRALFALLTVAGILMSWTMANRNWIRERRAFEAEQEVALSEAVRSSHWGQKDVSHRIITSESPSWIASATLRVFGERAHDKVTLFFWGDLQPGDLKRIERVYPEATSIHCLSMPLSARAIP